MIFSSKFARFIFIFVVVLTVLKQLLMGQVILAAVNGEIAVGEGAEQPNLTLSILPTDKDDWRPYKWKGEDVTMKKYIDTNGAQMVEMEKEIPDDNLNPEQKKRLDAFGLLPHPCCNAPINTKDCLHAVASMGLAKYLITQGWDDTKIKKELFLWYRYWWPKHYAIAATYLQSKGVDPQKVSVDDWMSDSLSNIRSEEIMLKEINK